MKIIPNFLTAFRIVSIPFIIYFFIIGEVKISIILTIIAALTDFVDGKLARLLNAQTELGAKLDAVSDKFFSGGLLLTIALKYHLLFINFTLELFISLISLFFYNKTKITKTLYIGKIKTWFLFVTVILGFVTYYNNNFKNILFFFSIITALLQLSCIIRYIKSGILLTTKN